MTSDRGRVRMLARQMIALDHRIAAAYRRNEPKTAEGLWIQRMDIQHQRSLVLREWLELKRSIKRVG